MVPADPSGPPDMTAAAPPAATPPTPAGEAEPDVAGGRLFRHALVNTLVAGVVNFTVWFAVTFWVYLQTRSVFATGVISGIFLALTAGSGIWFGSLVDR
jgi:DHA3 family multidrug efflux protein-like MFS transporter